MINSVRTENPIPSAKVFVFDKDKAARWRYATRQCARNKGGVMPMFERPFPGPIDASLPQQ